jgi:lysophospholipase L1-like esterase
VRYAAMGDSFTEGVGDPRPDGSMRGWADLVAEGLSRALAPAGETVEYVNVAIRGRLLRPIIEEQLPALLALDPLPDLVTLNGGGNDFLRPGIKLEDLVALTEQAVVAFKEAGVRLVILSGADPSSHLPMGKVFNKRAHELTERVRIMAAEHGLTLVDAFNDAEVRKAHYWSADRLHLNPIGHARVAGLVLHELGYGEKPTPAQSEAIAARGFGENAQYWREHVLPWINRRLRGTSSGDNVVAKHATWHPVTPG